MFESGVLKKILGPEPEEITDYKGKLHNEVFHELESLPPSIIRKSYEVR